MLRDIGLIGLGVMGSNLIRNIERNGYGCAVYNRTHSTTERFMAEHSSKQFSAAKTLPEFVALLKPPRRILVMVQAGKAVDLVLDSLLDIVSSGDTIVDLGNSYFIDTEKRIERCASHGVNFLGVGVSGGEEGALIGPSIMAGGPKDAWMRFKEIFDRISAKAPDPCHAYCGPGGAGHFVKMVHNGIEYGDMQLIAESYHLLTALCGLGPEELSKVYGEWNRGVLSSFLLEITSKIFAKHDELAPGHLVDKILDKASQKGTGKWTAQVALDLGCPIPTIALAVDARILSSLKGERVNAGKLLPGGSTFVSDDKEKLLNAIHDALYCSKITAYAQGVSLLQAASNEWKWNLSIGEIASIWRGGCIIRADFLSEIMRAYSQDKGPANFLVDPVMSSEISKRLHNWREIVSLAAKTGIPTLALGSALSYYDSYRSATLPQNLTQAQRDFFGAHTYERLDKEGIFHTKWE